MRFSTVAFTLLGAAASASASTLVGRQDTLPSCAVPCTTSADLGGCVVSDTHCLCTNPAFVGSTTTCIEKACTDPKDLASALAFSQGLCLKVGVTLSAPAATGGSSSGSPAASTPPAASPTPTTPATSGSAPPAGTTKASGASVNGASTLLGLAAAGLVAFAL
ncbi:hypothetical protein GALMADRAFT_138956 [Galerina marginata CBS 339.88]|uniref:CFEM domain-containing protein n=1 Tax=Galerina marginata (strain CBS 339.88) TaxID=685588 RepID=A0A067T3M5_GALM3|nr:hypothetical protein GALMADRAFT_138956 [Galerina marginata CBS 339.88]